MKKIKLVKKSLWKMKVWATWALTNPYLPFIGQCYFVSLLYINVFVCWGGGGGQMDNKTLSHFVLCMCAICFMMGNPRTRTNRIFFFGWPGRKKWPGRSTRNTLWKKCDLITFLTCLSIYTKRLTLQVNLLVIKLHKFVDVNLFINLYVTYNFEAKRADR